MAKLVLKRIEKPGLKKSVDWLFVCYFAVLSLVVPLGLVVTTNAEGNWMAALPSLIALEVSAFFLAKVLSEASLSFFQFFFWAFSYIWMGLAPWIQFSVGITPSTTPSVNLTYLNEAIVVLLLGLASYQFGVNSVAKSFDLNCEGSNSNRNFVTNPITPLTLTGLSVASLYLYIQEVGISALFKFRNEKFQYLSSVVEDTVQVSIFYSICWALSLISGIYWIQKAKTLGGLNRYWLLATVSSAPALIVANPISTGRYISGCVYGGLLIAALYKNTPLMNRLLKFTLLFSLIAIFPILNFFRSQNYALNRSNFYLDFTTGDYDAFAQFVTGVEYKDSLDTIFSFQFLGPLLFWIPRTIWPQKPYDTGIVLANYKGYLFTNLSAPLWVEMFICFTLIGVVVLFYLLGKISSSQDLKFHSVKKLDRSLPAYIPLAIYSIIILRGSLLQAFGGFVLLLVANTLIKITSKNTTIEKRYTTNQ